MFVTNHSLWSWLRKPSHVFSSLPSRDRRDRSPDPDGDELRLAYSRNTVGMEGYASATGVYLGQESEPYLFRFEQNHAGY